jgi:hypothetical protein
MPPFAPVIDVNRRVYCGPYAIAVLTGVPVTRIEKMLRRRRKGWRDDLGRKLPIKSAGNTECIRVLETLGCKVERVSDLQPTLGAFCRDREFVSLTYLVNVTDHYVVVHKGTYCDSGTRGVPKPIADAGSCARWKVHKAWVVTAPERPRYTIDDPIVAAPRPKKPKPDLREQRMAALAAQIKRWETKEKRAKTALKKLRPKLARYQRQGVGVKSVGVEDVRVSLPEGSCHE